MPDKRGDPLLLPCFRIAKMCSIRIFPWKESYKMDIYDVLWCVKDTKRDSICVSMKKAMRM